MQLYHYRSVESALAEIGDGTFHFASRDELNDPIEGFLRVYWQGDKSAWEGLFRNYICSLYQAIEFYQLRADEEALHHQSLVIDIHARDHTPLGEIWKRIGDQFTADPTIQRLAEFYGRNRLKISEKELRLILHFVHGIAAILCIKSRSDQKRMPEKMGNRLLELFSSEKLPFPFEMMDAGLLPEEYREKIAKTAADTIEDMRELHFIHFGLDEDISESEQEDSNERTAAGQLRSWMTVFVDFPKIYVNQLRGMVYPESLTVCFSIKNDDSAMWGHYAENHRGVCFVYDFGDAFSVKDERQSYPVRPQPVCYEGELIERNFFETFGRLTIPQIRSWLTGTDGLSDCFSAFADEKTWRDNYWAAYEAKTYRKLKDWEYEQEHRVTLANIRNAFDTAESRNLKYDPEVLKGVIFGIRTSEYDKKQIMEKLQERREELRDFVFYQAEYDDAKQEIVIRKKRLWTL